MNKNMRVGNQNVPYLLEVINLKKTFSAASVGFFKKSQSVLYAVNNISFQIKEHSTLGLVGESGSGKSTAAYCVLLLHKPDSGKILLNGIDLLKLNINEQRNRRKDIQMIFQDPYSSLNPMWTVKQIIEEPLRINSSPEITKRVKELIEIVSISGNDLNKHPHEFSGGQRQRISIARAVALNSKLIICDEPVSALDVSIKAQILNLLQDLKKEFNMSFLYISHDLGTVKYISDVVAVMYLGKIVETAKTAELFKNPIHPYTKALLSSAQATEVIDGRVKKRIILKGDLPDPTNPPSGCFFQTRCQHKQKVCLENYPPESDVGNNHLVSCFMSKNFI